MPLVALAVAVLVTASPSTDPNWLAEFRAAEAQAKAARADGRYRDARDSIAGYARRWSDRLSQGAALDCPASPESCRAAVTSQVAEAINLAGKYGRLAAIEQRAADGDPAAWRELARELLSEGQRRYTTGKEKTRLFRHLVEHDPKLSRLVGEMFPVRAEVKPLNKMSPTVPAFVLQALERGGAEIGLHINGGGSGGSGGNGSGGNVLEVQLEIEEHDTSGQAIFQGNNMKSYGAGFIAELKSPDGTVLARAVDQQAMLGISVRHAAEFSLQRGVRQLLVQLVDDLLFRVYRDEL